MPSGLYAFLLCVMMNVCILNNAKKNARRARQKRCALNVCIPGSCFGFILFSTPDTIYSESLICFER